jgi:hypothetical protein
VATKKKAKRGRPPSDRGTPPLRNFRCHDDDWKLIGRAAKSAKKPVGTYVRVKALEAARNDLGLPREDNEAKL